MRSPAFQFYADDFLAGTAEMTNEEVGAYIRLLCHQWSKGSIPGDMDRISRMAGAMAVPSLGYVMSKFKVGEDGAYRNERLEAERMKQEQFRSIQAKNGKNGAEKRWNHGKPNGTANGIANGTAMATPLATAKPNDSSPSPSPSPNNTPPTPKGIDVAPDRFDEFWNAYPRKESKESARKAWRKVKPSDVDAVIRNVASRKTGDPQWTKDGGQFIPHAATYLNQRRWEDESVCDASGNRQFRLGIDKPKTKAEHDATNAWMLRQSL